MLKTLIGVFSGVFIASLTCEICNRIAAKWFKKSRELLAGGGG